MKFCPQCQQTFDELENTCPNDGTILYLQDLLHLVGCTIAKKYVVERLAGIGGMSAVYRAYHREMERPVALKILLPHLTLNDPDMVRMFEREARAAGQINHPNVATIYDTGRTAEDMVYLSMEWLEGHTLEKIIRQNAPLNWETTALLLEQIAAGLTAAHQCRIIHRDLKPGNIMVLPQANGSLQVKILDFGIAKIAATEADNYVSTAVGTVHYASPEQMIPGNAIDARTDLYALGVMMYEMLTGRLPFEGNSVADLIRQHLLEPPLPLSFNRPDAPDAIVELIEQMLAKKPMGRPASAQEVWTRFEQARRAKPQPRQAPDAKPFTDVSPTVREIPAQYNTAPKNEAFSLVPARVAPREPAYESSYESGSQSGNESEWPVWENPAPAFTYAAPQPSSEADFDVRDLFAQAPAGQPANGVYEVSAIPRAIPMVPRTAAPRRIRRAAVGGLALLLGLILVAGWRRARRSAARLTAAPAAASVKLDANPITTASQAALQSFTQAKSLAQQNGKGAEATQLLQQALAADEEFALAHMALAQRTFEQGDTETAYTHADRAEALNDKVSERERWFITASHQTLRHGDLAEAVKTWQLMLQAFPQAHDARAQLIQAYLQLGQFDEAAKEAAQLRTAQLSKDDASLGTGHALGVEAALALNRTAEARTIAASAQQRRLALLSIHHRLFQTAVAQNNSVWQNEQLKWLPILQATGHGEFWQAERATYAGHLNDAATFITQGGEATHNEPTTAQACLQLSLAYTLTGQRSRAKTLYEQAARLAPNAKLQAAPTFGPLLLAMNGDSANAKKLADEIAAQHPRHTLYQSLWLPLTRAALALQARKPDEALQQLQQLDRYETASHLWAYWLGAQAHLQKKQPEAAARLLQRLQTNAGLNQLSVMRPLASLGLAQAAQQMGDTEQSKRHYETFFVQWETADADLPIIKAARTARAALR